MLRAFSVPDSAPQEEDESKRVLRKFSAEEEEEEEAVQEEHPKKLGVYSTMKKELLDAVKELPLDELKDLFSKTAFNRFPMHFHADLILALLHSENRDNQAKLDYCQMMYANDVIFTSVQKENPGDAPIHVAASLDFPPVLEFCTNCYLSQDEAFAVINRDGDTPLHVASSFGALKSLEFIQSKVGKERFEQLVRTSNRAGLTCFDVAAENYLVSQKKDEETPMEFKLRAAKELLEKNQRKEEIQRLFSKDPFFIPIVYYHPDCLDHLAITTPLEREQQQLLQQQQQQADQQQGSTNTNTNNSDAAAAAADQQSARRRRRSLYRDPAEAWESPDRLNSIMQCLNQLAQEGKIKLNDNFEPADRSKLELAHSLEYVNFIVRLSEELSGTGDIVPFTPRVQSAMQHLEDSELKSSNNCDTGFSEGTLRAATRAAGGVCAAIDSVLQNQTRRAFCVVRPPGHHAGRDGLLEEATSCGFCVFNNVMIGAMHALPKLKKVAIVDLDVHHGNGTEEICREFHARQPPGSEPRLLFLSTHLHDHVAGNDDSGNAYEFYPGSGDASDLPHNVVNIPLRPLWRRKPVPPFTSSGGGLPGDRKPWLEKFYLAHFGRLEFRRVIEERILPPLRSFHPDLILISAGFDAAKGDVGNCRFLNKSLDGFDLLRDDFYWVAREISKIADICCEGRVVGVLEGGYGKLAENAPGTMSSRNGAQSGSRRGGNVSRLDRMILAKNVLAFVEGLAGGPLSANTKPEEGGEEENESEEEFMRVDEEQANDYVNSDEGLTAGASRRSGRGKRARRSQMDSTNNNNNMDSSNRDSRRKRRATGGDDDSSPKNERETAMLYMKKVRELPEGEYQQFLKIMQGFKSGGMDVPGVVKAVKILFAGRPDLIAGFNNFIPKQHKINEAAAPVAPATTPTPSSNPSPTNIATTTTTTTTTPTPAE